ncbi:BZ3500_MvSof-1268-A1-R1_Chr4-4g07529 [Microbotryum saponariae]|uniref:BZ3500_MvSof-1268-A1-R1_Chr4-4g07529 protein n=1 Tax=Microbotryum saponariae TaxID=289078 RepID=A0A2X0LP60_9BASI|nr:BZ3500_MvSof-1268-A1-R1_Chr4-4g07529 [Microbotryum saponariae]SDA07190.1 BZ3501_MvSof-1269-A2-R1_Chr4-3g07237 [Microbotryum saponariae]
MTPPIAIGSTRRRRSKSCIACRVAKLRCEGLDEEQLHQLESNPALCDLVCHRCERRSIPCTWAPSRRPGRPRRLNAPPPIDESSEHLGAGSDVASGHVGDSFRVIRSTSHLPAASSTVTSTSHGAWQSPSVALPAWQPSRSAAPARFVSLPARLQTYTFAPNDEASSSSYRPSSSGTSTPSSATSALPSPVGQSGHSLQFLEHLGQLYLSQVHGYIPVLPNLLPDLSLRLQVASPSLVVALEAYLIPWARSSPSPPPPPNTRYPNSDDQLVAIFHIHRAYANGDLDAARTALRTAAGTTLSRARAAHMTSLGRPLELDQEGWILWELELQVGTALCEDERLLDIVRPDTEDHSATSLHRQALLHLWHCSWPVSAWTSFPLPPAPPGSAGGTAQGPLGPARPSPVSTRAIELCSRAFELYNLAHAILVPASPQMLASDRFSASSQAEAALNASIIASTCVILVLSGPLSPEALHNIQRGNSTHSLVFTASNQIIACLRRLINDANITVPPAPTSPLYNHSPFLIPHLWMAARGLLIASQDARVCDRRSFDEGIGVIETVLSCWAERWPEARRVLEEVGNIQNAAMPV